MTMHVCVAKVCVLNDITHRFNHPKKQRSYHNIRKQLIFPKSGVDNTVPREVLYLYFAIPNATI